MINQKQHGIVYPSNAIHISTIPLKLNQVQANREKKKEKGTEADAATTQVPVLRVQKQSSQPVQKMRLKIQLRESNNSPFKNHTFQTVLITEGMGNFKDRYYYTKESLQNAVNSKLFEGLQCFADHPTEVEEQIQPERSTRDILGYYENVSYEESADGTGMLIANLCMGNSISLDWAMSLLTNSIDYSTKFRESDLVGLSINASGSAQPMELNQFIQSQKLSPTVLSKLNEAQAQGITQINVVNELTEAQSVDLVTKAGAGGKILKMLEMEKTMAKKKFYESEMEKKEGAADDAMAMAPGSAGTPDHADAAQDQALFAKMIKQYLGNSDASEEEMEMAKEAYEAHKESGMEHKEAYEAAGNHLKMAMAIGKKMAQKQAEKHESETESESEGECKQAEGETPPPAPAATKGTPGPTGGAMEKKKEAMVFQLSGEVAKLRESLNRYEVKDYLERKMRESGRSNQFTKRFKEALGVPKSKTHIDDMWKVFLKAADAGVEEVGTETDSFLTEKSNYRESANHGGMSFSDCLR